MVGMKAVVGALELVVGDCVGSGVAGGDAHVVAGQQAPLRNRFSMGSHISSGSHVLSDSHSSSAIATVSSQPGMPGSRSGDRTIVAAASSSVVLGARSGTASSISSDVCSASTTDVVVVLDDTLRLVGEGSGGKLGEEAME